MEENRKYLTRGLETFKQKEKETFVFWTCDGLFLVSLSMFLTL